MHPVRSGIRAVVHQPALILAEIAWRWSFGAAAWVLLVLALRRILAGIDISEAEYLLARRSDVFLIADACARVLYQALPAFVRLAVILVPALALIWAFAATLGRAATIRAILFDQCHPERASAASESKDPYSTPEASGQKVSGPGSQEEFVGPGAPAGAVVNVAENSAAAGAHARGKLRSTSLLVLHLLRALFTLATLLAFIGTMILAGSAFPAQGASPTAAAMIWVILAAMAAFFWTLINWFLALAPIWIVRDGRGPFPAIGDSLALFRRDSGAYVSAAWWFGLIRGLILLAAFMAALFAAAALESARAVAALSLVIALFYFAAADFLYIARLAAYVALADESPHPSAVRIEPPMPEPQPAPTAEP